MFDLELTLDLYYVPPMDETGFGICVSRDFELPFQPTIGLQIASESFGIEDGCGLEIKDVTWDVDRKAFLATTRWVSQDLPITFIADEIRDWIARGWTLGARSTKRRRLHSQMSESKVSPFLELEAEYGPVDDWPAKPPKERPANFNKLFRAIIREMAELHNNCAVAYAMDETKTFVESRRDKPVDQQSSDRFERAKAKYEAMGVDQRVDWLMKANRYRPSLATLVASRR